MCLTGVYIQSQSTPLFTNCYFEYNSASDLTLATYGGGAYALGSGTIPTFTDCTVRYNWALFGSGVMVDSGANGWFTGCKIDSNGNSPTLTRLKLNL